MESSNTDYLIVPKEEMLDDLVIPDHCEDDTDGVIPKEELFETSLHLDDALNEPNVDMVMPIKTELILCENIAQLRRQYESAEHGSVSDQDVFTGDISAEINRKRCEDSSVHAACAATSEALMLKKCKLSQRDRTAEKLERPSCDVCENHFRNRSALIIHMRTHTGEKPHSCDLCQKKFMHSSSLKDHMRSHTGEKPYSCELCQNKFVHSSSLKAHMRTHTGEKPYSCELCQKKFSRSSILLLHMRTHTGEKPFSCEVCQNKFALKGCLQRHMRIHTGEKAHSCNLCQKKFAQKYNLSKHMRTHTGEKPYSRDVCENKYASKNPLIINNLRTLTEEKFGSSNGKQKIFICYVCEKKFKWRCELFIHMRTHPGGNMYLCELCQKKITSSRTFQIHMSTHTGVKPHSCDLCQKKFMHSRSLIDHMRTHTGEKPYSCDLCKKKFMQKCNLARHIRTHLYSWSCDLCNKKFANSNLLFTHNLETHIEEKFGSSAEQQKLFPCNVCVKQFVCKSALDIHMGTHTGEKPNSRDLWENKFASTNLLIMHNLGTHIEDKFESSAEKQKLFPCYVCQRQFIWRSALDNHMRTHTGEKSNSRGLCENASTDLLIMHNLGTHTEKKFGFSAEKQKLFPCNVCQRQFIWRSALDNHMRTHTDVSVLKKCTQSKRSGAVEKQECPTCDVCKKQFKWRSHLIIHLRTHTGEKPHSCDVCHKTFTLISSLTDHMRTHTKEKPYSCKLCQNKFASRSILLKHMRTHTDEKPYSCKRCQKKISEDVRRRRIKKKFFFT